ncbi:tetratricopeptide repeat protein [Pyruvatibacter mobilis]|uniref:tetratricopeptide repeat protein n=1 Tax=Pyruvatibacter mobilis TaxID=1712261 RepID=UPI003BA9B467
MADPIETAGHGSTTQRRRSRLTALPVLGGSLAAAALIWAGVSIAEPTTPVDAAERQADTLEEANKPAAEAPRPLAGDPEAIAKVVAEAPRTEQGGFDLYRRGLYPEALMVWQEAAANGDAGAAYRVGATYMDGQAVPIDLEKGVDWLRKSAEMGEARAMGDLGSAYDWGFGVPKDRTKAAELYEQAARKGHAASQYNIGVLYEEGEGVEQDLVKAYMFYLLSNENGFPKYPAEAIAALEPKLTNEQIKKGVDAARSFDPI